MEDYVWKMVDSIRWASDVSHICGVVMQLVVSHSKFHFPPNEETIVLERNCMCVHTFESIPASCK